MNLNQRSINTSTVFDTYFLDGKGIYMFYFNKIPSLTAVYELYGERACEQFRQKYASLIRDVHTYRAAKAGTKKAPFDDTYIVLDNGCVVEFSSARCDIYHDETAEDFVTEVMQMIQPMKERRKRQPLEINIVVNNRGTLELRPMEVKRVNLDIDLFYEDDFKAVDEVIRKRLNRSKDKGIVLLHGLPGTAKTTYLRYLIGKIKKRVLFLSPDLAGNLVDPEFVQLLTRNSDSVLIIEDAENIIMDRRANTRSAVSNLLNISDGLLADFLNVQLICTFNNALTMVDNALLRKGRLIARYEFGKLGVRKSQRLSDHLGFDTTVNRPMTVAEIANQHEKAYEANRVEVIGFRREVVSN